MWLLPWEMSVLFMEPNALVTRWKIWAPTCREDTCSSWHVETTKGQMCLLLIDNQYFLQKRYPTIHVKQAVFIRCSKRSLNANDHTKYNLPNITFVVKIIKKYVDFNNVSSLLLSWVSINVDRLWYRDSAGSTCRFSYSSADKTPPHWYYLIPAFRTTIGKVLLTSQ